jgi:hypothetical protein
MSLPLKDFRLGITESIDVWLDAEAVAFGKDKAAVAREVLAEWSKRKAHAFKVAHRRLAANGAQTDWLGDETEDAGVMPADAGASRKAGR